MDINVGVVRCSKKVETLESMKWTGGEEGADGVVKWIQDSGTEALYISGGWKEHRNYSKGGTFWEEEQERIGIMGPHGMHYIHAGNHIVRDPLFGFHRSSPINFASTYDVEEPEHQPPRSGHMAFSERSSPTKGPTMSKPVGMALRITENNRHSIAVVNAGVVPKLEGFPAGAYFVFPYDADAHCRILPSYAFKENYRFAKPENLTSFVDVVEY